ncbi:MAG: FkbM family methyltransferase [Candidatus Accumulibacter sp.]|nr:FkbM family methyltransferase [Accumulibacter sp.]
MKILLKKIIKAITPYGLLWYRENKELQRYRVRNIVLTILGDHPVNFHGQSGEDILLRLFMDKGAGYRGFYVDIGAFHPVNLSNTNYFYGNGWNGMNIDANPSAIKEFNRLRTRDINIESGVSDEHGELEYYYFGDESSINSFSRKQAEEFVSKFGTPIRKIMKIKVLPINDILHDNLPAGQHIDFITLDVEGFEMRILKSLDFEKYSPDYFLVEDLDFAGKGFMEFKSSPLNSFLNEKGYTAVGKTNLTILFKKREK